MWKDDAVTNIAFMKAKRLQGISLLREVWHSLVNVGLTPDSAQHAVSSLTCCSAFPFAFSLGQFAFSEYYFAF